MLRGRGTERERLRLCFRRIGRRREDVTVLFYEPPGIVQDIEYEIAREHAARVYGPDERATHRIPLPATWRADAPRDALKALEPAPDVEGLVVVTSGKTILDGHRARLRFLERLRDAGVPFELFGTDLPSSLGGRGPIGSKHDVLRRARFTLAIENDTRTAGYVTEKLWDPLLAWSLPLYLGSEAADAMIPRGAFVRLPDLGDAGVERVREALAHPRWREERLDAMRQARAQVLGPLRLVEWLRTSLPI